MSFALAPQSKNKEVHDKTSTPVKRSSHNIGANDLAINPQDSLIHLQQMIGNQALQRLMRSNPRINGTKAAIQTKLKVSQPGDAYEQEADRVAEQVMSMSNSNNISSKLSDQEEQIDRKCPACEVKDKEESEKLRISRKPSTASNFEASNEVTNQINSIRSSNGSALDTRTKRFMESRFGYDFSSVRIHTDEGAARSANSVNALAYTVGNDVVFGQGQYQPDTIQGKKLLGHELTHVAQQAAEPTIRRTIRTDEPAPIDTYLRGKGVKFLVNFGTAPIPLLRGQENIYEAKRGGAGTFEQELLIDMLASPREFAVVGSSTVEAEKSLSSHLTARKGIVSFANQKKYSFASLYGWKMNPAYYDFNISKGTWSYKPGVDKQKAWDDLNVNPQLYAIGCAAATTLTQKGGSKGAEILNVSSSDEKDWVAGDAGYVENTKFPEGSDIGIMGENIIYTGSDQFWGHLTDDITFRTLQEWKIIVARWHGGSKLDTNRAQPMTGLS